MPQCSRRKNGRSLLTLEGWWRGTGGILSPSITDTTGGSVPMIVTSRSPRLVRSVKGNAREREGWGKVGGVWD